MRAIQVIHVEDMITASMRQRYPDIERIGIRHSAQGWRCESVWMSKGAASPSDSEYLSLLAEADRLLADVLREYEIVQR
jgi:hypothetical protein